LRLVVVVAVVVVVALAVQVEAWKAKVVDSRQPSWKCRR
jgi:hypothetical protein